ncbi:hypothetical protein OEZ81_26210, partial [Leclercia adecarboxylata]|uniref:hypothetical protein n=1 Tax=Leclercia adecarboxylata TaxID=83655 RepID=UPI00234C177D
LTNRAEVSERLLTRRSEATLTTISTPEGSRSLGTSVELYGITPGESLTPHWPLLATQQDRPSAWAAFDEGAVFVNEQLATAENLTPGDQLTLSAPGANETLTIAAIYPDYGNPSGQVLMASSQLAARFDAPPSSMGLVLYD